MLSVCCCSTVDSHSAMVCVLVLNVLVFFLTRVADSVCADVECLLLQPGSPTLRVLHLTDIHLDTMYSPGSQAVCKEPLCCRASDGKPGTTIVWSTADSTIVALLV